ncbi:ATP-binding protein [Sphaerospermopsis sp. LEGE 08334]|jgi:adenylate kinase|uniref:ATP-binding protein n=1 Tax=Sphaerospermopsis sp. LEGE 08334 TaxID=1828651 RepID=UPI00187F8D6B|nr:ATP-binding protein [Sphaerospermopsis sp. LEGE 08334]MBE9057304.1 AAA family ATPase [Sphaerospermopsis sp. LEGE 08334]
MDNRKIIFVGGIHGVGKTTLCKKIESRYNIEHFSASNLIAREKAEEHLRNKQVENVAENQDYLVTAINKYFQIKKWYLLDGHFCLLNTKNEITKIPYSTYQGIFPSAILLLIDEPENIYNRLNLRDSITHDLALLRSFQEQEIYYSQYIRDKLNIPYLMCNVSESEENIYSFVEGLVTQDVYE